MNQSLWTKAIQEANKEPVTPSIFKLRQVVSKIVLYSTAFVFTIIQTLLNSKGETLNIIPFSIILAASVVGLVFSYGNNKKPVFLFYALPLFCLLAAEFLNDNLMQLYGEVFMPLYLMLILVNYILCSARIALIYSIGAIVTMMLFYAEYGFNPQIIGTYWLAYTVIIVIETVIGYFASKSYEVKIKSTLKMENTDDLTNLLNRNGFIRELKKATYNEKQFYVVLLDIDKFDELDDNLGCAKADEILKVISTELAAFPESFAHSRFNNDKFAFISQAKNALILTSQLDKLEKEIKAISEKYVLDNTISFSTGIVFYPEQSDDIAQLLNFAEIALEKSKTSKAEERNTFFIREYLDDKKRSYTIQKDLLTACRNGELQVFYQPKISLVDKVVTGMEALSRWTHPSIGYVTPDEFIKIAERSGHIVTLGEFVMENALYHIHHIHELGFHDVSISINVSPLQLMQNGFCENIYKQTQNFGVEPSKIYLEITEGTMLRKDAAAILKRLKEIGFNLSLDDFGTGYSSLNYLHKYSFDELKIDKSFTDGLMRGRNERRLFKFLILLARELGMKTVTEGVEDDVQIKLLQGLGAEEIQGWYYSKALSSFDCIEYIRNFRFNDTDINSENDIKQTNE